MDCLYWLFGWLSGWFERKKSYGGTAKLPYLGFAWNMKTPVGSYAYWTVISSWYLNKGRPTRWHLLYYLLLNVFQTLIRPSSGACDYLLRCVGWLEACWCYVAGLCRLNHYSVVVQPTLGYHITNRQSRYITPARLKSAYTTQVLASSWRWTY